MQKLDPELKGCLSGFLNWVFASLMYAVMGGAVAGFILLLILISSML